MTESTTHNETSEPLTEGVMTQAGGIVGPDDAITHYKIVEAHDQESVSVIVFGSEERPGASPMYVHDLLQHLHQPYHVEEPRGGWRSRKSFSEQEKRKLRPIAETLAMLAGNAFFGQEHGDGEWYEMYLPEAAALYENNGGDTAWAGRASFAHTVHP